MGTLFRGDPSSSLIYGQFSYVFQVCRRVNSYCNDRAMTRDEKVYPDAGTFKPERFIKNGALNTEIRDPRNIVFGFGRQSVLFRSQYWISTLIPLFL
jgi:hypothetical protein